MKSKILYVQDNDIAIVSMENEDYISLTDIARSQMQDAVIIKWLSLKSTIEYLGEWEILYNENFNCTEFGTMKNNSGSNNFVLSVKNWIEATNSIGITAKAGRCATFAHKDIVFHFGMWISPRFQLLLIKEYQRLKTEENNQLNQEWNIQRTLAKINYKIHTDAITNYLHPNN
jgi:KilA-N domain